MRSDAPRTVAEARLDGWNWVQCRCRLCRRSGEVNLWDVTDADDLVMPIGRFLRRFVCGNEKCGSRDIEFHIGARNKPSTTMQIHWS